MGVGEWVGGGRCVLFVSEDCIYVVSHVFVVCDRLCAVIEDCTCISCSCSDDKDALKAILPQFVPRMAHKWDSIGIQLAQAGRVSQLRNSPEPNEKKMQDILDAWIESAGHLVSVTLRSLFNILRSSDVGLHDVAKNLEEVCRLHGGWDAHALGSQGG